MSKMLYRIAAVLDSPSVFMGGPSQQNLKRARDVLLAMREPTAAMLCAEELQSDPQGCKFLVRADRQIWQAMIDAELDPDVGRA